jgi:hypothetical protein
MRRVAMRVRDLRFGLVNSWPPSWTARPGTRCPLGEEGILRGARVRSRDSVMVRIFYDDHEHEGLFVWDGPPLPSVLADLLNGAAGRPINEVGDLEIPPLL